MKREVEMPPVDAQILSALRSIARAIDVWSRELLRDAGLTAPQLAALREILAGKNVSPVSLARALHLSQPTVTGILQRLKKRGLLRIKRSTLDRRVTIATVTPRGQELARQAPPLLRDRFRKSLRKRTQKRQAEILAALREVATMLEAPGADESPFLFLDSKKR